MEITINEAYQLIAEIVGLIENMGGNLDTFDIRNYDDIATLIQSHNGFVWDIHRQEWMRQVEIPNDEIPRLLMVGELWPPRERLGAR